MSEFFKNDSAKAELKALMRENDENWFEEFKTSVSLAKENASEYAAPDYMTLYEQGVLTMDDFSDSVFNDPSFSDAGRLLIRAMESENSLAPKMFTEEPYDNIRINLDALYLSLIHI